MKDGAALLLAFMFTIGIAGILPVEAYVQGGAANNEITMQGQYVALYIGPNQPAPGAMTKQFADPTGAMHNYTAMQISGGLQEWYYVRDGYSIFAEQDYRHSLATTPNMIRTYKIDANADDGGLLSDTQVLISYAGITTLNEKSLNKGEVGAYAGGVNSNAYRPLTDSGYVMEIDGKWVGDTRNPVTGKVNPDLFNNHFHEVTKDVGDTNTYRLDGKVVPNDALYAIRHWNAGTNAWEVLLGVFTNDVAGKEIYRGKIFGFNNEVLMTAQDPVSKKYYSYWATEVVDPNAPLSSMTMHQFNNIINELKENDLKLHEDDLKKIDVAPITGGGTIALDTNGGADVPGTVNVTGIGGTNGQDLKIHFANRAVVKEQYIDADGKLKFRDVVTEGAFDIPVGAAVIANNGIAYTPNAELTDLKINGQNYKITGVHDYSVNSSTPATDTNYNNSGATGSNALAAGVSAKAAGIDSIAIGYKAEAPTESAVAIGNSAGTSLGTNASGDTVFIGVRAGSGSGDMDAAAGSTMLPNGGEVGNHAQIAIGIDAGKTVNGSDNIAVGRNAGQNVVGNTNVALSSGAGRDVDGHDNFAALVNAGRYVKGISNIAIGKNAGKGTASDLLDVDRTIALSEDAQASKDNAIALGYQAKATASVGDVAVGAGSETVTAVGTSSHTVNGEAKHFAGTSPSSTVSVGKAGVERTITNVAAGRVSGISTDAVNGSQLFGVIEEVNKGTKYGGDTGTAFTQKLGEQTNIVGGITDESKLTAEDNLGVVSDGSDNLKVRLAKELKGLESVTAGTAVLGKAADGKSYVTGLDNKTWDPANITSGRAATEDQLKVVDDKVTNTAAELTNKGLKFGANSGTTVTNKLGSEVKVLGGGTKADTEYSSENVKTKVSQGTDGTTSIEVMLDKNLTAETIQVGKDGKDGKIGVAGANGKDGVTIWSEGPAGQDGVDGHIGLNGKDGASADIHVHEGAPGVDGAPGTTLTRIVYEDKDGNTHDVATLDDGMKYGGDTGTVIKKKLNGQVNVVGGITDESKLTAEDNLGVVSDGSDNLKVRLAKELKGLDSVGANTVNTKTLNAQTINVGDTQINNDGIKIQNGPSVTKAGIDAGNSKVTNVMPGKVAPNSTDAINGSQLYQTNQMIQNIGGSISKLDSRVNKVGAGSAALAALHPLDFDPDDKWNVAAGYGNYRNGHAAALGAFYRPDENTMFSLGATVGNGENMVNAGVTFALDRKSRITTSRTAMAREIMDLRKEITELKASRANGNWMLDPEMTKLFPDIPENHWAYEYITKLAGNGLIEGYPDGNFNGDRMMTRYEFAAMLYRAMGKGAQIEERALKEFAPEMGRIRVDRIYGADNNRNKIERVRVNNEDKNARDTYGSKLGQ